LSRRLDVATVPGGKGLEELKALAPRRDRDLDAAAVLGRLLVAGSALHEAFPGDLRRRRRRLEDEALSVGSLDLVRERVLVERPRQRIRDHDLGTRDEGVRARIAIVALAEVPVVGVDDRVLLALRHVVAFPLADAGAAGVREHEASDGLEVAHLTVALDRLVDLLGTRCDPELRLRHRTVAARLSRHVGCALQVLVRGVGAAADQCRGESQGIAGFARVARHTRDGPGQIGRVRAHDVGLEAREVDLHHFVEEAPRVGLHLGVGLEQQGVATGEVRDLLPTGRLQVERHALVVGEDRRGRPELRAHVRDGALARTADPARAGAEVLDDPVRAALHGQDLAHLEDHVLGRRPAGEAARQMDPDELRIQHLPGKTGHHIHGVGSPDTACEHAEAPGIRRVGVGAEHHAAGKRVLLEHHLVDDARAGSPESDAVARRCAAQEVGRRPG
jgi:hypothetical protein